MGKTVRNLDAFIRHYEHLIIKYRDQKERRVVALSLAESQYPEIKDEIHKYLRNR